MHDLNLTGVDLTYTIVFNTENGEQNIVIIVLPIKTGIGNGILGQTFYRLIMQKTREDFYKI